MLSTSANAARGRRLVVVRAGDASLHPSWLQGSEPPTFDVAVSYYGDDPTAFPGALRHAAKGGKWDGLHAFFLNNPDVLDNYDWVWLPDDDIAASAGCVNRLFDIVERHDLAVAQPSLSWESYYSHFITLQNRSFRVRWTNFAEVMVPLFSSAMLRRLIPVFAEYRFGWGLDYLWARWMSQPSFRTAIVDAVAVHHTRPGGKGSLYKSSRSPLEERDRLLQIYGLGRQRPRVYAGLDTNGRLLTRGLGLGLKLYAGWMPLCREDHPAGKFPIKARRLIKVVRRMVLPRSDLTPLTLPYEQPLRK